jgi:hypothetical protein
MEHACEGFTIMLEDYISRLAPQHSRAFCLTLPQQWRAQRELREYCDWDLAPHDTNRATDQPVVWGQDVTAEHNFHPYPLGNNKAQAYVTHKKRALMQRVGADVLVIRGNDLERRDLWLVAPGVGERRQYTQHPHLDFAPYRTEYYPYQVLHCMQGSVPGSEATGYLTVEKGLTCYGMVVEEFLHATCDTALYGQAAVLKQRWEAARNNPCPDLITDKLVYAGIRPLFLELLAQGIAVRYFEDVPDIHAFWARIYELLADDVLYVEWEENQTVICRQEADGYMHGRVERSLDAPYRGVGQLLIQIS